MITGLSCESVAIPSVGLSSVASLCLAVSSQIGKWDKAGANPNLRRHPLPVKPSIKACGSERAQVMERKTPSHYLNILVGSKFRPEVSVTDIRDDRTGEILNMTVKITRKGKRCFTTVSISACSDNITIERKEVHQDGFVRVESHSFYPNSVDGRCYWPKEGPVGLAETLYRCDLEDLRTPNAAYTAIRQFDNVFSQVLAGLVVPEISQDKGLLVCLEGSSE